MLGNQISNVPKEEGFSHVETKQHSLQKQQSVVNNNKLVNDVENTSRSARRNRESSEANQGFVIILK